MPSYKPHRAAHAVEGKPHAARVLKKSKARRADNIIAQAEAFFA